MNDDEWQRLVASVDSKKLGLGEGLEWYVTNKPNAWASRWNIPAAMNVRIAIAIVELVLPEWNRNQLKDTAPLRAVDAARKYLLTENNELKAHLKATAKACTASRKRSLGYEHRIAEAARAVAIAASSSGEAILESVSEAIAKTEEHILYRFAIKGIYDKETEVRRKMLCTIIDEINHTPVAGDSKNGCE